MDEDIKYETLCESCGQKYTTRKELEMHQNLAMECGKPGNTGTCKICDVTGTGSIVEKTCSSKHQLLKHMSCVNAKLLHTKILTQKTEDLVRKLGKANNQKLNEIKAYGEVAYRALLRNAADKVDATKFLQKEVKLENAYLKNLTLVSEDESAKERYVAQERRLNNTKRLICHIASIDGMFYRKVELYQKMIEAQNATFDGENTMIIDEYWNKRRLARRDSHSPMLSHMFYTSDYGYCLQCRTFMNGFGEGQGTYLSIFVHVVEGEFDDLLKWPVELQVFFEVLNQKYPERSHILEPLGDQIKLKRPVDGMSNSVGTMELIAIDSLDNTDNGFLVDDSIILRALVTIPNATKDSCNIL